jgi:endonuclease/exonuclease/phosphatase family metal-dependent hydrolase
VSLRPEGVVLEGCPCVDEICRHIQTFEGSIPYQDDYIYVSEDLVTSTRFVEVDRTTGIEAVSDHFPLIVELDA